MKDLCCAQTSKHPTKIPRRPEAREERGRGQSCAGQPLGPTWQLVDIPLGVARRPRGARGGLERKQYSGDMGQE